MAFAELCVTTNFSFLRGASHPEEFVRRAAALGHRRAAIADRNTLAGVVRAHVAADECGIGLAVGARIAFVPEEGAPEVVVFPTDRAAYGRLAQMLTTGKRRAEKGECLLGVEDLCEAAGGIVGMVVPPAAAGGRVTPDFERGVRSLREAFGRERLVLGAGALHGPDDRGEMERIERLGARLDVGLAATADVHYHERRRRALQDVLTATRLGTTVEAAGAALFPNGERHLKAPGEMARLFRGREELLGRAAELAEEASRFSLSELRYHYPSEVREDGRTALETLVDATWRGAAERYGETVPPDVRSRIEHEFTLIQELDYAPYFLTVHDIVRFARSQGILCQGRGAAANSAVCYCLGVTAVDPDRIDLLFERFLSKERNEPPDIDIDFEHERREEVLQYVYRRYGRDRAAMEIALGMQGLEQELSELPAPDQVLHIDLTGRNPDDGMTAVAYDKGAAFLRSLEHAFGRERMDRFLREWFDAHSFQSVTTERFLDFLQRRLLSQDAEAASRLDVAAWVEQAGLPDDATTPASERFASVDAAALMALPRGLNSAARRMLPRELLSHTQSTKSPFGSLSEAGPETTTFALLAPPLATTSFGVSSAAHASFSHWLTAFW